MIFSLLLALAVSADCDSPLTQGLNEAQRGTVCATLTRPAAPATVDRSALENIYARERFQTARDRNSGLMERFGQRFFEWLGGLFETSGAARYANSTRFIVLFLAALAVVVGVLRGWNQRRQRSTTLHHAEEKSNPAPLLLASPATHIARARSLLATDARAALREGLFALLSHLESERWARPDRVKTNQEVSQELATRGAPDELTHSVSELMRRYDDLFYSLEPVPTQAATDFIALVEAHCGPHRKAAA
ncbi:MAG: hypothetical protein K1X64_19165 [Myxococcaceae bacterium]|nr:hypothetical protein [Myxococcaceae bacterium]